MATYTPIEPAGTVSSSFAPSRHSPGRSGHDPFPSTLNRTHPWTVCGAFWHRRDLPQSTTGRSPRRIRYGLPCSSSTTPSSNTHAGVCTGRMLVAPAGLLDGRPAATHGDALSDTRSERRDRERRSRRGRRRRPHRERRHVGVGFRTHRRDGRRRTGGARPRRTGARAPRRRVPNARPLPTSRGSARAFGRSTNGRRGGP